MDTQTVCSHMPVRGPHKDFSAKICSQHFSGILHKNATDPTTECASSKCTVVLFANSGQSVVDNLVTFPGN